MRGLISKKLIFLISCFVFLLFLIPTVLFLFLQDSKGDKKAEEIGTTATKYKRYLNQDQIENALNILRNEKLPSEQRYESLKDLAFYFSTAYAASHEPAIREYVGSIKSFAKTNYPKYYEEGLFDVGCADPSCGEKPDEEIKQIQKEINEAGIQIEYLDTINKNLEQSIYIPIEQIDDKKYGFELVIEQLIFENNPKASAAAEHLTNYVKRKYSIEFTDVKIKEPEKL